jgi:hypothetical protein
MNYIFLSYYPISKNIIFMAKDLLTLPKNELVSIHPTDFYSKDNKKVSEWVWTRGLKYNNNNDSWNHYFDSFPSGSPVLNNFKNNFDALKYIFQLNKRILNKIINKENVHNLNSLTIHIRRGDTMSRDNSFSHRNHFSIDEYVNKTKILLEKYNYNSLIVCTDSKEDFEYFCNKFSDMNILNTMYDRSIYMRANESTHIDMEDHYYNNYSEIEKVIDLSLIDLWYASNSSACIGTMGTQHASFYSRLICALQKMNNPNSISYDMFGHNYDPNFITEW